MTFSPKNLLILGAGFSWNAGLPLASEFTQQLLNLEGLRLNGPSAQQVSFIRKFVDQIFGEGEPRNIEEWPELEDIFTLIDLSANTGHNLGQAHSASDLRIVRRSIIVRMIRMLSQAYLRSLKNAGATWQMLEELFTHFNPKTTGVLSMNWDTVFEAGLARTQSIHTIAYGCHANPVRFKGGQLTQRNLKGETLHILKPHGSTNWLYCDACRETFWVTPHQTAQVAQTLFQKKDWETILSTRKAKRPKVLTPPCPHCSAKSLGTRFATFSYRKALDFPMHTASWRTAEEYLKCSSDWVFIGYSMPAADFEFKHLLKRVQLTESIRPKITVITGGSDGDATIARFTKFFGNVDGERFFFKKGLDRTAMQHLTNLHVLKP